MKRSAWVTLGVLSGLGLVTLFGETMVQPALPNFIADFGITYETSLWILSAFLISGAVMTPISGKLSDIYGRKRVLLIIMGVYCGGVLAAGLAQNIEWMIGARVLMGVGFSAFPIAFGMIREGLPPSKLGVGQTVFGSTFSAGSVIGLVVGAGLIQAFGWRIAFFAVLPVAVLLTFIIRQFIRDNSASHAAPNQPNAPLDYRGVGLLTVTVVSFLVSISLVQNLATDGSVGLEIGALLIVSAAGLAFLTVAERRTSHPLIDIKLMTKSSTLLAILVLMVVGTSTFMVYQTISILVQSPSPLGFGGDKVTTAGVLLPFVFVLLLGTIGSGFVLNRLGNVRMTLIGTALSAVGFLGLLFYHSTELAVTGMLALIAAGLSFAFTGGFNVVLLSAPIESTGTALGMTLLLNLIAQSIGPAVAATFQQTNQETILGVGTFPNQEAYFLIFATAAFLSVLGVGLSLVLSRRAGTLVMQPWPESAPPVPA